MSTATVRECLLILEESTYGNAVGSPVFWPTASPTAFYVPLIDGNAYTGMEEPAFVETPYGGGIDVPNEVVADHRELKGSLSTLAYPDLAAFLAKLAITKSNGSSTPFANTEPAGDLASVTLVHGIKTRDGTTYLYAHSGMKVASFALECSSQDPRLKLKIDWVGSKETPNSLDSSTGAEASFTWPTEAQLPKGPYLFSHTAGNVTFNSGTLTKYDNLSLKITNKPDPRWWETHWAETIGVYGRDTTCDMDLLLKGSPNLRSVYQSITSAGFSVIWNNGTHSLTVQLNGNNHMNKLPYDLPLGKEFMQKTTFRNKYDQTAGADVSVSST
jgi:hypothetical protein